MLYSFVCFSILIFSSEIIKQIKPKYVVIILIWFPFRIISDFSTLHPRFLLLLKIEISLNDKKIYILYWMTSHLKIHYTIIAFIWGEHQTLSTWLLYPDAHLVWMQWLFYYTKTTFKMFKNLNVLFVEDNKIISSKEIQLDFTT